MNRSNPFVWPALALAAMLFYGPLLFQSDTTIHWDGADQTYPAWKFLGDELHGSGVPFGARNAITGARLLADPAAGAAYPLHWPVIWFNAAPKLLALMLALHCFLAMGGTYLLVRGSHERALVTALLYGFGGFFAARSSQLAIFECAALLPWLLWATRQSVGTGSRRWAAVSGSLLGLCALTGSVAGAVAALVATALYADVTWSGVRRYALAPVAMLLGVLVAGLWIVPAVRLHAPLGPLEGLKLRDLTTLFAADYYGVSTGLYSGPGDLRAHYLYGSILLLPLGIAGVVRKLHLWGPLALVGCGLAMSFVTTEAWFPAALGLALLAGQGIDWLQDRVQKRRLWIILLIFVAADLWHANMYQNPMVLAHTSFDKLPHLQRSYPGPRDADPAVAAEERAALKAGLVTSGVGAGAALLLALF